MAFLQTTAASISSGGTINGDITIEGDLTVNGDGAGAYDEIINGNLRISASNKLEFGDTGTYIHQSADGVLDLVSDTELELNATTIDINGAVEISGNTGIGNTPEVNFHIKLSDTANARIEDTSADGIAKLDFKNDVRQATIGVYGDDSDNFKIDHGGGAVLTINTAQQVGIGVTPTTPLHVKVNTSTTDTTNGLLIEQDGAGDAVAQFLLTDTKRYMMGIDNSDSDNFVINTGAGDLSSGNRLTFDSDMNAVFPGTLTVNGDLAKVSGAHPALQLEDSDDSNFGEIGYSDGVLSFTTNGGNEAGAADTIVFYNHGSTERMRISSAGNVGIGTSAPASAAGANALDIVDTNTSSSSQGASLRLGSNDGGAMGDDHRLGVISFRGSEDGAGTMTEGARIDAICDAGWSATENGASLRFFTTDGNAVETERMIITSGGNIGFGVQPSYKLDVSGDMRVEQTADATIATFIANDTNNAVIEIHADDGDDNDDKWRIVANTSAKFVIGHYSTGAWVNHITLDANSRFSMSNNGGEPTNTIFGYQAGNSIHGSSGMNTFVGHQVADATMTADADENTAVGHLALSGLTSGTMNTIMGSYAGINITSGDNNVLIGRSAGNNHDSSNLVAIGTAALASINNANGNGSVAVGHQSQTAMTSGSSNTSLGYFTLHDITTEIGNVAIGYKAGEFIRNDASDFNVIIGQEAGVGGTAQRDYNVAIGYRAMGSAATQNNIGASQNVFIGAYSGNGTWVTAASSNNTAVGYGTMSAGAMNDAGNNSAFGADSLKDLTTGDNNTAIGQLAATDLSSGSSNVAVGRASLYKAAHDESDNVAVGTSAMEGAMQNGTVGDTNREVKQNVAIGSGALYGGTLTSTSHLEGNIAIGHQALDATGANNQIGTIAIGTSALGALTDAVGNTAIGYQSADALTTSGYNTAVGYQALSSEVQGTHNVAFGYQALFSQNKGSAVVTANIGIGVEAGYHNDTGVYNVWLGYKAGTGVDGNSNSNNVGIGFESLNAVTTGSSNTVIGKSSGDAITTGNFNTVIGANSDISAVNGTDQVVIGEGVTGIGNNWVTLGNSDITNIAMAQDGMAIVHAGSIQFPATQQASADANNLDDYEEGTWSPAYTSASNSFTTMTMDVISATYTKVGRQVTCRATFRTDNVVVGSASGVLFLSGLPFTVESNGESAVSIGHAYSWASNEHPIGGYARGGETRILLVKRADSNDATSSLVVGALTTGASADSNGLVMSVTYFV